MIAEHLVRSTEDLSVGEGSTEALVYNVDGSSRSPWQLFSTYRCLGPMPSLFFFFFAIWFISIPEVILLC